MTSERVEKLAAELTLAEQVSLTAGASLWETASVPRLDIPAVRVTDGPNGARGPRMTGPPAACSPCGSALGATWDPQLVREVARVIGEDAKTKGARVLLAPTVNLHRAPLAGRNFECHSEDPWLSARMAVAYVEGVQATGVAATVKHFTANDAEWERMTASSEVDERTLRELYLRPFEAAVVEAGAWAVMTAYNRLGGTYCSEHAWLIETLLRDEWGFDGLVMSDWFGTHSTVESVSAGLDLEMPGPPLFRGDQLVHAVDEGAVPAAAVAARARRVLQLAERVGAFDGGAPQEPCGVDRDDHRAVLRRAATDAVVLLRNEGAMLPLRGVRRLAVIGPNADDTQVQGGGSAAVVPHRRVSVLDALRERCGDDTEVVHEPGCVLHQGTPLLDPRRLGPSGLVIRYSSEPGGEVRFEETAHRSALNWLGDPAPGVSQGAFAAHMAGRYTPAWDGTHVWALTSAGASRLLIDGAVVVDNSRPERGSGGAIFGFGSAEVTGALEMASGRAYELVVEFTADPRLPVSGVRLGCLPAVPGDLVDRAVAAAASCDAAVVVVGTTPEFESEGFDRPGLSLPGQQDLLIERVAAVNPRCVVLLNTGAPVSAPWASDVAAVAQLWLGGQEVGHAAADVLFGDVNPCGRLPTTFPVRIEDTPAFLDVPGDAGRVRYSEGVFAGYRWYDARRIEPQWCFGHGLSYTTFEYRDLSASSEGVSLTVANTGEVDGREVVQVYVGASGGAATGTRRPLRELRGFAKVSLPAGEAARVDVPLGEPAFRRWDAATHGWLVDAGEYEISVGASSRDLRLHAVVTVEPAASAGGYGVAP